MQQAGGAEDLYDYGTQRARESLAGLNVGDIRSGYASSPERRPGSLNAGQSATNTSGFSAFLSGRARTSSGPLEHLEDLQGSSGHPVLGRRQAAPASMEATAAHNFYASATSLGMPTNGLSPEIPPMSSAMGSGTYAAAPPIGYGNLIGQLGRSNVIGSTLYGSIGGGPPMEGGSTGRSQGAPMGSIGTGEGGVEFGPYYGNHPYFQPQQREAQQRMQVVPPIGEAPRNRLGRALPQLHAQQRMLPALGAPPMGGAGAPMGGVPQIGHGMVGDLNAKIAGPFLGYGVAPSSPFVPAATARPFTGMPGGWPPPAGTLTPAESAQTVGSGWSGTTSGGGMSIGSLSFQGGSMAPNSRVPSSAGPSSAAPEPAATPTVIQPQSSNVAANMTSKIKVVCSSGGKFTKVANGIEYQGGETRLIAFSNFCSYQSMLEALERVTGSTQHAMGNSNNSELMPSIKYRLPSEPTMYVDLMDDEDTQLMFDEWNEYVHSEGRQSGAKLHLFVDWNRASESEEGSLQKRLQPLGSNDSAGTRQGSHNSVEQESLTPIHSAESLGERGDAPKSGGTPTSTELLYDYDEIAERMEVISPNDVTLVKFIGSGGYGEVYLGKWHSSEAAIKCLNPSLFYNPEGGEVSHAAIMELIKEADLLGSLRHPNVVWVYGIVLPPSNEHLLAKAASSDAVEMAAAAATGQNAKGPMAVRPPAIVTEYMSQGSLKGALQRKADIVQGALIRVLIAMDAAKGMDYLHSKQIVHFDLKSANLLLGYRDRRAICKVADFGLSKQKRDTYVSGVSSQRGTLPWIAPEIIKSPKAVTERVDVYSFGIVMWELWTSKEPYEGLNYHALLHQITVSPVGKVRPPIPGSAEWPQDAPAEPAPGYCSLMQRCWAEEPRARPTFREIVAFLRDMATALRVAGKRESKATSSKGEAAPSASGPGRPPGDPQAGGGSGKPPIGVSGSLLSKSGGAGRGGN